MLPFATQPSPPPNPDKDKKRLYAHLQDLYFLPPRDSKGVTLLYLRKVRDHTVFVVDRKEMALFLADLTPTHMTRSIHCCKFEAYAKLEKLLAERGCLPLGFDKDLVPDGCWLYKVARLVDRENLTGLFVHTLQPVVDTSRDSEKLYNLQRNVERELLGPNDLGKRSPVKRCIEELQVSYRRVVSRQAELAAVSRYRERLKAQAKTEWEEMQTALGRATLVVHQLGNGVDGERALMEQDERKKRIADALKLVYTVDCVIRRDEETGRLAEKFAG